MNLEAAMENCNLNESDSSDYFNYKYIDVFKNGNNMPINQIHLERTSFQLKAEIPEDIDFLEISVDDLRKTYYKKQVEVIPALDKRWLPKCVLFSYEPYSFISQEENQAFITKNTLFIESLEYLLKCNFHQFWCTILFEPSAIVSIRSFILNPIPPYQARYIDDNCKEIYKKIFNMFALVYERLCTFKCSQTEYMTDDYGYKTLSDNKLINLPIVNTIAYLYKNTHIGVVNKVCDVFFSDTSQLDFRIKEVEDLIQQNLMIFEMIEGHICGFHEDAVIVPLSIEPKPAVFSLKWIYSVVNYLLNTVLLLNSLLQFHKPAVEMGFHHDLPYKIPFTYTNIYRELYELIGDREELKLQSELSERVFDEINVGRSEFIDLFHVFVSSCLDKTLESIGDSKQQEEVVETYLKLLTTALEDEYFMCDYNSKYPVENQNDVFESCTGIDHTRTSYIVSCVKKLPRHKKLQELSKLSRQTIEDIFKKFKPVEEIVVKESNHEEANQNEALNVPNEKDLDLMITEIVDMFPHLGDGFVLQCLECYNYNSQDVINAILEENLAPHLYELPFDTIRIPPEPEPEKPIVAYRGKKPDYEDALSLLNDKRDNEKLKTYVLEGIQYSNDYLYDDEYDDRDDDEAPIKVADNPLDQDILICNPNHADLASDTSYSSEDDYDDSGKPISKDAKPEGSQPRNKLDFCEDPAVIRARREARFRSKNPQLAQPQRKPEVKGKPKGQGQEKDVLKARDKKNTNKASRANHNRKSGAQFKRNRGMLPS